MPGLETALVFLRLRDCRLVEAGDRMLGEGGKPYGQWGTVHRQ